MLFREAKPNQRLSRSCVFKFQANGLFRHASEGYFRYQTFSLHLNWFFYSIPLDFISNSSRPEQTLGHFCSIYIWIYQLLYSQPAAHVFILIYLYLCMYQYQYMHLRFFFQGANLRYLHVLRVLKSCYVIFYILKSIHELVNFFSPLASARSEILWVKKKKK